MIFNGFTYPQISNYYYDHFILEETGFNIGEDQTDFDVWLNDNNVTVGTQEHYRACSVYMTWWELGIIRILTPSSEMHRCG